MFVEMLWSFSQFLEAVAIFPQSVLMKRDQQVENLTSNYVFCLGLYRALYLLNWIFKLATRDHYRYGSTHAARMACGADQGIVCTAATGSHGQQGLFKSPCSPTSSTTTIKASEPAMGECCFRRNCMGSIENRCVYPFDIVCAARHYARSCCCAQPMHYGAVLPPHHSQAALVGR